jgi:hypothetical protein
MSTSLKVEAIISIVAGAFECLDRLDLEQRVAILNEVRAALAEYSPFRNEPVDFVRWVPAEEVQQGLREISGPDAPQEGKMGGR